MPKEDGTGPRGTGPGTGWGTGPCSGGRALRRGIGRLGRGWFNRPWSADDQKSALETEEKLLKQELEAVRKERADLKGQK